MPKWLRKTWRSAKSEIGQLIAAIGLIAGIYEFSDDFIASLAARRLMAGFLFVCCVIYYIYRIYKALRLEALGVFLNKKMSDWLKPFFERISRDTLYESENEALLQKIWEIYPQAKKSLVEKELRKIIINRPNREEPVRLGAIIASAFWAPAVADDLLAIIELTAELLAVKEQAVIALGKMKCTRAIPIFQSTYDTVKNDLRKKMLKAAEKIGQNEQGFYEHAALCSDSDDEARGEAMRLLAAEPTKLLQAVDCLRKILANKAEPPNIRSEAARCLGELKNNAENELLDFCEEKNISSNSRKHAVLALKHINLRNIVEVRDRLTALYQDEKDKNLRNALTEVIRSLK